MIVTLTGENSFLVKQELSKIITVFSKKYGDLAIERIDAEETEANTLAAAVSSMPFLQERKMVIIKNPGSNKIFCESIAGLIEQIPDTNDVILLQPKIDKRQSYYKILQKDTDFRDFSFIEALNLAKWIENYAAEQGGKISSSDAKYLLERIGSNQLMLANELDKLILYSQKISRQTIDLMTEASINSTIFKMLDAAFTNRPKQAINIYKEQRLMKVSPHEIIGILAWQLHLMALVIAAGGRSASEIARTAKINPYSINNTKKLTKNMSLKRVKQMIDKLASIDQKSKTQNYNLDAALMGYMIEISV